jgi:large subunit ribosomal protein L17
MRHLRRNRKLNRTASHRQAMYSNMVTSLFAEERLVTTIAKAKEVRGVAERLITYAKKGDLHRRRLAARFIKRDDVLKKLFEDIAGRFTDRQGGYTRILHKGSRAGDNAQLCYFELTVIKKQTDEEKKEEEGKAKAKSKPSTPKKKAKKIEEPVKEELKAEPPTT